MIRARRYDYDAGVRIDVKRTPQVPIIIYVLLLQPWTLLLPVSSRRSEKTSVLRGQIEIRFSARKSYVHTRILNIVECSTDPFSGIRIRSCVRTIIVLRSFERGVGIRYDVAYPRGRAVRTVPRKTKFAKNITF